MSPWWPKLYDMEHRSDSLELECHVCVYIGLCSSSVRSSNTSAPLCFRPGVMAVGVVQIWSQVLLTLNTVKQWRQTYSPTASVSSRFGYTQDLVGGCNWPIVQLPHRHLQQTSIGCTHHNAKTGHTGRGFKLSRRDPNPGQVSDKRIHEWPFVSQRKSQKRGMH